MEPHTVEFERPKTLKISLFCCQKNLDMPAADSLTEFHEREKDSSPIRKSATRKDRSSSESP